MAIILIDQKGAPVKRSGQDVLVTDLMGVVKSVDMERRTMTIVGTDETVDRMGDIIRMSGWELENYLKNPVFLWCHDYHSVPIAAASKLLRKRDPKQMVFYIRYPSKGLYPFADLILSLYNEKIINASSVGMIAKEWSYLEEEPKPGRWNRGREFTKQELLELSGCPVPANPNALQQAMKSFGFGEEMPPEATHPAKQEEILGELKVQATFEEQGAVMVQVPSSLCEFEEEQDEGEDKSTKEVPPPAPESEEGKNCDRCEGEVVNQEYHYLGRKEIDGVEKDTFVINPELDAKELKDTDFVQFEEKDYISLNDVEKPYPTEHACRLAEPGQFDKFARKNCYLKSDGKCVDCIFGIKDKKSQIQAMRYPKEVWTASQAKSHCAGHKGKFEAASGKDVVPATVPANVLDNAGFEKLINDNQGKLTEIIKGYLEKNKLDTKGVNEGLVTDLSLRLQTVESTLKILSTDMKTLKDALESLKTHQAEQANDKSNEEAIKSVTAQLAEALNKTKTATPETSSESQPADPKDVEGIKQITQELKNILKQFKKKGE